MKVLEPVKYIKDMLGVGEGTLIDTAVDTALGYAPVIGKVIQDFKINRLAKRMKSNEGQLLVLKEKIESSTNEIWYKQEIFPLIVNKIMEDDEDKKAKVIIDGFEHIIDNDLKEIERVYHYYDVLSELRYSDIVLLVDKYMPYEMRKNRNLNINLVDTREMDRAELKKHKEMEAIQRYQINKFIRLGLLVDEMINIDGGDFLINPDDTLESRVKLSDFGRRFLEFFSIEDEE